MFDPCTAHQKSLMKSSPWQKCQGLFSCGCPKSVLNPCLTWGKRSDSLLVSRVVSTLTLYGPPPALAISARADPTPPPPPKSVDGTHRSPYTLIRSFDSCAGSFMFSRSAINCTDAPSDPLPVAVPATYGWLGAVFFAGVSERRSSELA